MISKGNYSDTFVNVSKRNIVIIGNGISGITAARHIRKLSDDAITVISSESPYFFSRTALMYVFMGHMKFEHTQPYENWFWEKNRINLITDHILAVRTSDHTLEMQSGAVLEFDVLIIASGSLPNQLKCEGENLKGVQSLYSRQDLELLEKNTAAGVVQAVIAGGGLIGIELAEMLASRKIAVQFLVREKNFWGNVLPAAESSLVSAHMRSHGIELRESSEVAEFVGDDHGRLVAVRTKDGEVIPCQLAGITAGVRPNVDFLKHTEIELGRGVKVDPFFESSVEGIYAIGDCAELREPPLGRRTIEPVWYAGRLMGEQLAQNLCGNPSVYDPGPWFNSAKFFDLEYQVYGEIAAAPSSSAESLYWEHSGRKKCLRIQYDRSTSVLQGIHAIGMRLQHEVIAQWLKQGRSVHFVVDHLVEINFDGEFSIRHEQEIQRSCMEQLSVNANQS